MEVSPLAAVLHNIPSLTMPGLLVSLLALLALYVTFHAVYNICLHPLREFPGPRTWTSSQLGQSYCRLTGNLAVRIHELHEHYGPVVRIAPNELSFISAEAWRTIYGGHASGFRKNYDTFMETDNQLGVSVFVAGEDDHSRMRKVLNKAFAEPALRNYDDMMKDNARILMHKLVEEQSRNRKALRIDDWFTWIAFDVIATACLGESFDCLQQERYRDWPGLVAKTWKIIVYASVFKNLVPAISKVQSILPTGIFLQKEVDKFNVVLHRTKERMTGDLEGRCDFLSNLAKKNVNKDAMTDEELLANVTLFMGAGIETVATVLPSLIFLLDRNKPVMNKLVSLIRTTFLEESKLTVQSVAPLEYLNACIQEAFRIFPPVAEGLPRVAPLQGCFIDGNFIPGKTFVQVSIFAANMSPDNFIDPTSFVPERWIAPHGKYTDDKRGSVQPFSLGPRACIGKSFALGEIRLVLAMLLWHFNVRVPSEDIWTQVPSYMLWEKKPLYVELKSKTSLEA